MSNSLSRLVPTATRCGPVALIDNPDALEALGNHPDAPRPDLRDTAFLRYCTERRGYSVAEDAMWSDITTATKGRLVDCWDLYLDEHPELGTTTDWNARKKWLYENIFA